MRSAHPPQHTCGVFNIACSSSTGAGDASRERSAAWGTDDHWDRAWAALHAAGLCVSLQQ